MLFRIEKEFLRIGKLIIFGLNLVYIPLKLLNALARVSTDSFFSKIPEKSHKP